MNREAVARAQDGDMVSAAALLRDAHRLEPSNELYAKNLRAALVNAGFSEIAAERFDRAVAYFVEALKLGDRGEIRRGLGYAYYRLGNLDLARTSLERALEQGAGDVETWVTLGRIYLEHRDQRRALAMFEEALAAGGERPGLAETAARLRRDAETEEGFHALASSHFVLKFEGRENTDAGRLVLNALEDAYRRVGARFAYYPLERLEVVLYGDEAFREVTNSPHWSGAVYDGRIKLPIGGLQRGSERLNRTLRHEYAHAAIVTLSRGKAPVWLNEGLAQIAEETGDEGRAERLQRAVAESALVPLSRLEAGFNRLDREQASLAYAEAYTAAEYLLKQKGPYNVRRLLEAMASAESTDAAFRQALSLPYTEFEQRFLAEVARRAR
jgi:tetratricopeptide (TPR) repeat protein